MALLSGCACDCADDFAIINIQFEGFTEEELKTIEVVNLSSPNTVSGFMNFPGNTATVNVVSNTQYQIKSDSISLNKVIQVNDIRSETKKNFACECTNITGIDYEFEGNSYTSKDSSTEPIVITN